MEVPFSPVIMEQATTLPRVRRYASGGPVIAVRNEYSMRFNELLSGGRPHDGYGLGIDL